MKNGFTLIELLGVIVVLSVISLITIPIIDRSLNKGKINLATTQKAQLVKALKDYYAENYRELNAIAAGGTGCKTINELKSNGKLPSDIKNPLTNSNYANTDKVCVEKSCPAGGCNTSVYEKNVKYKYYTLINGTKTYE